MTPNARTNWAALVALSIGLFVVALDLTLVAIALPEMRSDLGASTTSIEWVVLGYTLPMVALALPIGRFIDQVAARHKIFLGAVVGFGASSVAIGFAPSLAVVIAGRVLQGAFGAAITSLIPSMAMSVAAPTERARAMSVIATVGPLGAVAGPAAGGHLLAIASWHWVFFVNVPITILVLLLARGRFADAEVSATARSHRWIAEAGVLVVATGALLYGLTKTAEEQWGLAAVLGLIAVAGYVLWARTTEDRRLLQMLRTSSINRGPIALVLMGSFGGSIWLLVPFILKGEFGASDGAAGNTLLAMPLGMAMMAPVGGWLADRFSPQRVSFVGPIIACAGGLLLAGIDPSWSLLHVAGILLIAGIGFGLFLGPNMTMTMNAAPADGAGVVGSMTTLGRNLGFSLGPALATIVWHLSSITDGFYVGITATALAAALLVGSLAARRSRVPEPTPA